MNKVFATNSDISLQSNVVDLRPYFKLGILLYQILVKVQMFTTVGCKDIGIRKS